MKPQLWSFILQWSRVGINAALFLVATRFLTLVEIGLFATAFAPVRLSQGLHRAGITEGVIILGRASKSLNALFALSVLSGLMLSLGLGLVGYITANTPLMILGLIPLANGLGAVPEGLLRRALRLRALALRTVFVQTLAAGLALGLLVAGWGVWALICFALANAVGTSVLSCALAGWRPTRIPHTAHVIMLLPKVAQIAARDLVGAAQIPIALLAIGAFLGLNAAGAFQIATRIYALIDALSLSPLRFVALPQLVRSGLEERQCFTLHLYRAALLSCWIWALVLLFSQDLLRLVLLPSHASATAPILSALAGLGLCSALTMPMTQALTARLFTSLVLQRAIIMFCLGTTFLCLALTFSAMACALALSLAALLVNFWYVKKALPLLDLNASDLAPALPPIGASGLAFCLVVLTPNLPFVAQILGSTLVYILTVTLLRMPRLRLA